MRASHLFGARPGPRLGCRGLVVKAPRTHVGPMLEGFRTKKTTLGMICSYFTSNLRVPTLAVSVRYLKKEIEPYQKAATASKKKWSSGPTGPKKMSPKSPSGLNAVDVKP